MVRVVLSPAIQKELIDKTKCCLNVTWPQLAALLGVSTPYLVADLRRTRHYLSEEAYNKLCRMLGENYDLHIKMNLEENWGQIKGGKNVKNRSNLFKTKIPTLLAKRSEKLAEIIGIMLGDGSIYSEITNNTYQVDIAGHSINDKEYLLGYVKPLFEEVLGIKMGVKLAKEKNCLHIYKTSKDLVYTLNYHGMPSGNKKDNNVGIPLWIQNDKDYLSKCLRGIIDTDGSVYRKNNTHKHPTIWISSAIPGLRTSVEYACMTFGLKLSKWAECNNSAYITRKSDVLKYYSEIGFMNSKHIKRWDIYASVV